MVDQNTDFIDLTGLSFEDGDKYDEIENTSKKKLDIEIERNGRLTALFQQFLIKLKSDPDKSVIKWPNRIKDIEAIEKKIEDIYKGK